VKSCTVEVWQGMMVLDLNGTGGISFGRDWTG
jgi:hypothetical protein